jgi:hypothetical protein
LCHRDQRIQAKNNRMRAVSTIARATLQEIVRGRALWVAAALVVAVLVIASFLQQVALTERVQVQATVMGALLRAGAALLVAASVVAGMVREANDKVTDLLLAQAMPRDAYLLGKFTGYATAAIAMALIAALPLCLVVSPARAFLWAGVLGCELLIVAAVSLFCVLTLKQFLPAFATVAGFYVLARAIDAIRSIATGPVTDSDGWSDVLVRWTIDGIAAFMPPLGRMAPTGWLLDVAPEWTEIATLGGQTAVYVVLIGAASLFDLYRKNL